MMPIVGATLLLLWCAVVSSLEASPLLRTQQQMRIGVFSIPLYGHFNPLKAVAEELSLRGHKVTIFTEYPSWCASHVTKFTCRRLLNSTDAFNKKFFESVSSLDDLGSSFNGLFEEIVKHHKKALPQYLAEIEKMKAEGLCCGSCFDLVLTDLSTLAGFSVADKLNVPHVGLFPLVMHMVSGPATYLPSIGTGFPQNMSLGHRLINFLIKTIVPVVGSSIVSQVNDIRRQNGVPPVQSLAQVAGMNGIVMGPTIWGYDIQQPLCPNVFALGAMTPSQEQYPLEPELSQFLSKDPACVQHGAIYVNFGTLAVVRNDTFAKIRAALDAIPLCAVWKMPALPSGGVAGHFYLAPRFSSPTAIMAHPRMRAFITHCGDTSVGEAIQAQLPVIGIPFFADQGDVCQRVEESGIGRYVGHKFRFSVEDLRSAIMDVAVERRTQYLSRMAAVLNLSKELGGAREGAEIVERFIVPRADVSPDDVCSPRFRSLAQHLSCSTFVDETLNSVFQQQQYDVLAAVVVLMSIALVVIPRLMWWCTRKLLCRTNVAQRAP